jgi:hypothetical protein
VSVSKRKPLSASARRAISDAQKRRWQLKKVVKPAATPMARVKPTVHVSADGKRVWVLTAEGPIEANVWRSE